MDFTKKFDPSDWARRRAFNNGTKTAMRAVPIPAPAGGGLACAPLESGGWQIGWEWDQPRDIRGVAVSFAPGSNRPEAAAQHVEYWQRAWPTMHPDHAPGASRGWLPVDDAFDGRWTEAYGESGEQGETRTFLFDRVDINEVDNGSMWQGEGAYYKSADYNARFRRTLKLRLIFEYREAPRLLAVRLIGEPTAEEADCEIWFGSAGRVRDGLSGSVTVWNGEIRAISDAGFQAGDTREGHAFKLNEAAGQMLSLHYTRNRGTRCDGDRTLLQIATDRGSFSVWADDIQNGVFMEDFDIFLTESTAQIPAAQQIAACLAGKRSIFDRVAGHAEQTTENAFCEIPAMDVTRQPPYGRYVILGWSGVRQKFCLRYNGDVFANKKYQKVTLRDTARTHWAGGELHFRLATGDPLDYRERADASRQFMPDAAIPVYVTEWLDREVEYTQTAFATLLDGPVDFPGVVAGDEDLAVMIRIGIRNASGDRRTARLCLDVYPGENLAIRDGELLALGRVVPGDTVHNTWAVQSYDEELLRANIRTGGKGSLRCISATEEGVVSFAMRPGSYGLYDADSRTHRVPIPATVTSALLYSVELDPYETHDVDLVIPYPTLTSPEDKVRIARLSFDEEKRKVTEFWQSFQDRSAKLKLPAEDQLNRFFQAVPWHVAMTAMRDPNTGNFIVPAATYVYGACGNEASMQIRMLDYLGQHELAEKYLDGYVASQGRIGLDGNFQSKQGALVAVNYDGRNSLDGMFAYNLDHGYLLSCFADHYMLTGDRQWLRRVAGTLTEGCEFVFRERAATQLLDENGEKAPYYGLLPHGHLEDNPEWRCWFSVNGQACGGVLRVAKALAEIDHQQAERILAEGIRYRDDIRAAVVRAMAKAPAVPSGRGGYIPSIPTHAEIRGRDWGWFRQVAYGPLHLVYGLVLDPAEKLTTWILNDLEDNLFLSRSYGRIADNEKYWFSRGGIAIQSNLLFNDLVYLERKEPERALRALFNNFAQNLYRDISCFTEHPVPEFGHGVGPFFKTPDEAQFLVFLRNHLVKETASGLSLLPGASRDWFADGQELTFENFASAYGPVSLTSQSSVSQGEIRVWVKAGWRRAPLELSLYVRHPDRRIPAVVTVNGQPLGADCLCGDEIRLADPGRELAIIVRYD